jgi:hypothetical protein
MGGALGAVESLYFSLQAKLADMLDAAKTDADRETIQSQYVLARQNYWQCINKVFHEDDPALQALVTQANAVANEVKHIDKQLTDITTIITVVKQAVSIGTQIASKVITL